MKKVIVIAFLFFSLMGCIVNDFIYGPALPTRSPTPTETPFIMSPTATFTPVPSSTPTDGFIPPPSPTFMATLLEITYEPTQTFVPVYVTGRYLSFEHGFMVYREGANCLYAYGNGIIIPLDINSQYMGMYHYCLEFDDLPDAPDNTPEGVFGRVWQRYADVQRGLGQPTGSVVVYETTIPPSDPVIMGGIFYAGVITLPDGRALYCGARGATAGQCELRH